MPKKTDSVTKWVYAFDEKTENTTYLLGGKGAGLAEMTHIGLPVPPGFTVITKACKEFTDNNNKLPLDIWQEILHNIKNLENQTNKIYGDPANPLLVSVRSGSVVSMPGMMDTILNLGLNDQTVSGLSKTSGGEKFAYDSYRRFIQMYSKVVLEISSDKFELILDKMKSTNNYTSDSELELADIKSIVQNFKNLVSIETGSEFPQDPYTQLRLAVQAVFLSWFSDRANEYRKINEISDRFGTAVNIVAMVFGNKDENSGTGVAFTRNPSDGTKELFGEYLNIAQGEDVVAGIRTPKPISSLKKSHGELYEELIKISQILENHYKDAQDMEFTVESSKLYMLQTRSAKRSALASVKISVDMASEGLITKEESLNLIDASRINELMLPKFSDTNEEVSIKKSAYVGSGLNASPGAAVGKIVFDPSEAVELKNLGEQVILVREETSPDDIHGMYAAAGVLTAKGGATSHAAVVARGMGKPCITGCDSLHIDQQNKKCEIGNKAFNLYDMISIDGSTGEIFIGVMKTITPSPNDTKELSTILKWADSTRKLGIWANADTPEDAAKAIDLGAEGIGLCRTEHMFFGEERLPWVQQLIFSTSSRKSNDNVNKTKYHESISKMLEFQIQDFYEILKVMDNKPVVIRLIDPPLHEFLPSYEKLIDQIYEEKISNNHSELLDELEDILAIVKDIKESNPMLGLRGCRLGILYPDIVAMQTKAILTAASRLIKEGNNPIPEIMVPLVGDYRELVVLKELLIEEATKVENEFNLKLMYKIGTMIELPRAAITADDIAKHADFFSFGTNDLTQTTYGFSRDDAESKFLNEYQAKGILSSNPFKTLDERGVGQLMKIAIEKGKLANSELEIGICGEHGGDPKSISICHKLGLDYVSASPYRIPIARLAAAQATINSKD
jgi:pyruvate,orthophosphate dikinase